MALLSLTLSRAKPYLSYIIGVFVLQLIATMAALYLPSLNARIIDQGVATGDTDFIWRTGGVMLLVCFVQLIAAIAAVYCGSKVAMGIGRDLRRDFYRQVGSLSGLETGKFGAATLITRNTNDVQQVQMLVLMTLNFMVSTPIMCIGGIIMAIREDAGMSWLVWASVGVLFIVVSYLVYLLVPLFGVMQTKIDNINGVLREQITGIRVVRAFVREHFETKRYELANREITDVSLKVGNIFVLMFPVIMMILHLATAAVLWFGGHRVEAGNIEVGALTAFLQYLLQILMAVMMGVFMVMMIPRAVVCAERIREVLDTNTSMTVPSTPIEPSPAVGHLELRQVTFGYPGAEKPVLEQLSFTVEPGTTTAVVGSTGSGKSTLVGLLARLFDAQDGSILINGTAIDRLTRKQLSQTVALVPQKPYLFSGTIGSNLRFGRPEATDDELWHALAIAQATDFVRAKEHQLDERISQGGTNVSGGQRQRLSIARALVAQPKVYLFDDSFSALDVTTDANLRAALSAATTEAAVLIVAQRIATIEAADQILVLDQGRIVDRGTHDELLISSETYQEIVQSQLSVEEAK